MECEGMFAVLQSALTSRDDEGAGTLALSEGSEDVRFEIKYSRQEEDGIAKSHQQQNSLLCVIPVMQLQ